MTWWFVKNEKMNHGLCVWIVPDGGNIHQLKNLMTCLNNTFTIEILNPYDLHRKQFFYLLKYTMHVSKIGEEPNFVNTFLSHKMTLEESH